MMSTTPKCKNQITIRFTGFESGFLYWYAKHIDCDKANSIRHVLSSFLADHDQLVARYLEDTARPDSQAQKFTYKSI